MEKYKERNYRLGKNFFQLKIRRKISRKSTKKVTIYRKKIPEEHYSLLCIQNAKKFFNLRKNSRKNFLDAKNAKKKF